MRHAHTVAQVREAEAELLAALPEGTLMQRAATGLATATADFLGRVYGARVLLVVGSGDNGGDALWAGARLARRGARVEAICLSSKPHPTGTPAFLAAGGTVVTTETAAEPEVIIDGVVGIGGNPGLRPEAVAAFESFPGVPVIACDIPSGVDVDTGRLAGPAARADLTVTFGTHKIAHLVEPAAANCGVIELIDIGLSLPPAPVESLQAADVAALLPVPMPTDHKYTRGVLGIRAGSQTYPGAAVMCTAGAATGLIGMIRYLGSAADAVLAAHPEVVIGPGRVQAWAVGSGTAEDSAAALDAALADGVPLVVDADALRVVPRALHQPVVLTPHAGELAAMMDLPREQIEADQLHHARAAAAAWGCVVLLKGHHTLIAAPDGLTRVTTTGSAWLGVAGAGDVLTGVIGSLLAAGLEPFAAASVGSWLHGAAATRAGQGGPVTPLRVASEIPHLVRELLEEHHD